MIQKSKPELWPLFYTYIHDWIIPYISKLLITRLIIEINKKNKKKRFKKNYTQKSKKINQIVISKLRTLRRLDGLYKSKN